MAENPLLPHADLRALHHLLRRAVDPALLVADIPPRKKPQTALKPQDRAALLAGTLLQLRAGDIAVDTIETTDTPDTPDGRTVVALLRHTRQPLVASPSFPDGTHRLHLAAGLAAGLRRAERQAAVLVFLQTGVPEPGWQDALAWAQGDRLPLILAVADPSGPEVFRTGTDADPGVIAWPAFTKAASRLQLPILSVDGEDAVASYRVMQESLLRARNNGGPAVLWAALPTPSPRRSKRAVVPLPLQRLEAFMSSRKISLR